MMGGSGRPNKGKVYMSLNIVGEGSRVFALKLRRGSQSLSLNCVTGGGMAAASSWERVQESDKRRLARRVLTDERTF